MPDMSSEYREAVRRLQARRRLRRHVWLFLGVNAVTCGLNLWIGPRYAWCLWPLLAWGCGLGFHALFTLAPRGGRLQERRIREILATLRHKA